MKIAPVSGDLLVQLAIGAAVIGGAWWLARSIKDGAGGAIDAAAEWTRNLAAAGVETVKGTANTAVRDPWSWEAAAVYGGPINPVAPVVRAGVAVSDWWGNRTSATQPLEDIADYRYF